MMDEKVLRTFVRRDEAEPLLVAEPLHGPSGHVASPPGANVLRLREVRKGNHCERLHFFHRASATRPDARKVATDCAERHAATAGRQLVERFRAMQEREVAV